MYTMLNLQTDRLSKNMEIFEKMYEVKKMKYIQSENKEKYDKTNANWHLKIPALNKLPNNKCKSFC